MLKQYNSYRNRLFNKASSVKHNKPYPIQAGTPRTKPLGSCIIAIGFRPGILLTSTLQFQITVTKPA